MCGGVRSDAGPEFQLLAGCEFNERYKGIIMREELLSRHISRLTTVTFKCVSRKHLAAPGDERVDTAGGQFSSSVHVLTFTVTVSTGLLFAVSHCPQRCPRVSGAVRGR